MTQCHKCLTFVWNCKEKWLDCSVIQSGMKVMEVEKEARSLYSCTHSQPRRYMGWVVNATPRPIYSQGRAPVLFLWKAGQDDVDGYGKEKISCSHRSSNSEPYNKQRVTVRTTVFWPRLICLQKQDNLFALTYAFLQNYLNTRQAT